VEGLDIPADFADTPIALYGPGTDSGTFDFFTDVVNGEEGSIRIDYTSIGEDDNAAVTAISGDVGAMGYVPFAFYQESLDLVKGLEIDGGNGCNAPTPENVLDGSYTPLGRELYVYASNTALAKPETVEFFNFYINNAAQIAEIAGAVGLSPEQTEAQLAKVAALSGS
jgi:phosphate transport system substrate-binding protein